MSEEILNELDAEGLRSVFLRYTRDAFESIPEIDKPHILDIGCGPGMQTIQLAKLSDGEIIGTDIFQQYLDQLKELIKKENLQNRVKAINQSMDDIKFPEGYFDIIWAEGAIYIIGFERGLRQWRRFLKPHGFLVVHEMTWLQPNPPQEILEYWKKVYPGIKTIQENLDFISACDYELTGHFPLPEDAWWEEYYGPLEERIKRLRKKYRNDPNALKVIDVGDVIVELKAANKPGVLRTGNEFTYVVMPVNLQ